MVNRLPIVCASFFLDVACSGFATGRWALPFPIRLILARTDAILPAPQFASA
jgi:hypothetical protein